MIDDRRDQATDFILEETNLSQIFFAAVENYFELAGEYKINFNLFRNENTNAAKINQQGIRMDSTGQNWHGLLIIETET